MGPVVRVTRPDDTKLVRIKSLARLHLYAVEQSLPNVAAIRVAI